MKPDTMRHRARSAPSASRIAGTLGGAALALGMGTVAATPQAADDLPGADFYLDLSSGFIVSDNFDRIEEPSGTTNVWRNSVELGFESVTERERIGVFAGTDYDLGEFPDDPAGTDEGFSNPFASVLYGRSTRNDDLTFQARYAENDIATGNRLAEDDFADDSTDLDAGTGRRQDTLARLDFTLGREGPFGVTGGFGYQGRRFVDTSNTDDNLDDRDVFFGEVFLRFAPARDTEISVGGSYEERQTFGDAESTETDTFFGIGVTRQFRGSTRLEASAGVAQNLEENVQIDGERVTDDSVRPVFGLALERELQDGSIFVSLDQQLTDEGLRSDLLLGRNRSFPDASLAWTLGVSANDAEGANAIGSVSYARETAQGTFSIDLTQRVQTDTNDGDLLRTDLGLGWNRSLTRLSSLSLDLGLSRSLPLDEEVDDRSRGTAQLAYRYQLSEDWSLNAGYRYFVSTRTDREDITENQVFANVSRRFNLRP
jgi:hypothetical protein